MASTDSRPRRLAIHRKDERKIQWGTVVVIGTIHLLALLALREEMFTVSGLVVAVAMYMVAGMFGVTMCYHRLLTHRSFQTSKWVEYLLTFCAVQALQSGPIEWVAMHRIHHKEADEEPDPHSPLVSFLWAHAGWLFVDLPGAHTYGEYRRFSKDLDRDPVQRFFNRYHFVLYLLSGTLIYLAGELYGGVGLSWLVWGVFVRTVFLWHATWLVNSATHMWGYRNYHTDEDSTNNWLVALFSFGEGWHNNHHADQRSAAHGQRWFEIDITYVLIRVFEKLGLVWRVIEPSKRIVAKRVDIMVDDEALRLADALGRHQGPAVEEAPILHTLTDPTVPVEVPRMSSAAAAYEAAQRSARNALSAAETALRHAAEALDQRRQGAIEKADQAVKSMLERGKDLSMSAVEQAKFAAAEAAEFAAQASEFAAGAKERAAGSARQAAEQSRRLAQEAAEAASRAADEIARAFQGVDRPVISSTI